MRWGALMISNLEFVIGRFPSDGAASMAVKGLNTLTVTSILTALLGSNVIARCNIA